MMYFASEDHAEHQEEATGDWFVIAPVELASLTPMNSSIFALRCKPPPRVSIQLEEHRGKRPRGLRYRKARRCQWLHLLMSHRRRAKGGQRLGGGQFRNPSRRGTVSHRVSEMLAHNHVRMQAYIPSKNSKQGPGARTLGAGP